MFVERNGQAQVQKCIWHEEPKTDWSHPVMEAAVVVYTPDRQELGLDLRLLGDEKERPGRNLQLIRLGGERPRD